VDDVDGKAVDGDVVKVGNVAEEHGRTVKLLRLHLDTIHRSTDSSDAHYTVSQKIRHQTLGHNFTNYYLIFKIFSLADTVVNLQQTDV